MNIISYKKYDASNGPGIRSSIWIAGCHFHCEGCWNKDTWNFKLGKPYSDYKEEILTHVVNNPLLSGVSILGGEPLSTLMRDGDEDILDLLKSLKDCEVNVWMWSAYLYEKIEATHPAVLDYLDVLVDGLYVQSKRNLNLQYRGSENQRVIDVRAMRKKRSSDLSCDVPLISFEK